MIQGSITFFVHSVITKVGWIFSGHKSWDGKNLKAKEVGQPQEQKPEVMLPVNKATEFTVFNHDISVVRVNVYQAYAEK